MAYITQDDIENVFGASNVATWSNLDNDETGADTTRITTAISLAEGVVHNRFRDGPYTVPFVATGSSTDPQLKDWCAKKAGIWLYQSRPNRGGDPSEDYAAMAKEVDEQIGAALAGAINLACARAYGSPSAPVVILTEGVQRTMNTPITAQAAWGA